MSEEKPFRSPTEELMALTKEISEMKGVLREMSARLAQMERHSKRAFGVKTEREAVPPPRSKPQTEPGTLSPERALSVFDELVAVSKGDRPAEVAAQLQAMSIPDLRVLATEIGLASGSDPSRRRLVDGIVRRIRESVMLSRNTNVTRPRSTPELTTELVDEPPSEPKE